MSGILNKMYFTSYVSLTVPVCYYQGFFCYTVIYSLFQLQLLLDAFESEQSSIFVLHPSHCLLSYSFHFYPLFFQLIFKPYTHKSPNLKFQRLFINIFMLLIYKLKFIFMLTIVVTLS